jgi:hypothetical protein
MCIYFLCEYIVTIVGLEFNSSDAGSLDVIIVGLEFDLREPESLDVRCTCHRILILT